MFASQNPLDQIEQKGSFGSKFIGVKIEDFEFKQLIKELEFGKLYLAKQPFTGEYYDVLTMRKSYLLNNDLVE